MLTMLQKGSARVSAVAADLAGLLATTIAANPVPPVMPRAVPDDDRLVGSFDPSLVPLLGAGFATAAIRCRRLVRPVVVVGSAVALGGCGLLGLDSSGGRGDDFDRRVYIGGGVLASQLEPDADGDPTLSLDDDRSAGGSLAVGYDLSERLAVEGHVASLGEATFSPDGDITYQVAGISGIVYGFGDSDDRLVREGFSAFGRLGAGTLRNEADGVEFERVNDLHLLAGAGVEYGFENGLAVRGEFVAHDTDARYGQLGLLYRFGGTRAGDRSRAAPSTAADVEVAEAADAQAADARTADAQAADAQAEAGAPEVATTPVPSTIPPDGTALDGDADGVPDALDACTDTRAYRPVDERGCDVFDGVLAGVAFESGSDTLTAGARTVLADAATTLREYPVIDLSIEAHTDNQGSAESNLELSRRRALAVARFLASEGVEPGRLKPKAFGESSPSASNATPEGRATNRRVEFSVIE